MDETQTKFPFLILLFVVWRITFNNTFLQIMEIKVLGTGCAGCKDLYETVERVIKELSLDAIVAKEEDLMKIMEYNVMILPALVVNGKVVAKGKLSSKEVKEVLTR